MRWRSEERRVGKECRSRCDWSSDVCSSDLQSLNFPDGKGGLLGPQLVIDDGGDVTLLIHKGYEMENGDGWVNSPSGSTEETVIKNLLKKVHADFPMRWHDVAKEWRGVSEETTTGVHRLYKMFERGTLLVP